MTIKPIHGSLRLLGASACLQACLTLSLAPTAVGDTAPQLTPTASALLEQCVTALTQTERLATFAGEMTAIPNTARMEISIGLLERVPGEFGYRAVSAPGLGAWRSSTLDVKSYTYIKQVADLSAPAFYRGAVRFRWLNSRDKVIKTEELRTPRCEQPLTPASPGSTPGGGPSEVPTAPASATTTTTSSD
jgi:hypothetical protein